MPVVEFFHGELFGRNGNMLFLAAGVGETQINELHLLVLDLLQYVCWGHSHLFLLNKRLKTMDFGKRRVIQQKTCHPAKYEQSIVP